MLNLFQFLNGAIGVKFHNWVFAFNIKFQFLNGAIGVYAGFVDCPKTIVSIPKWCDWSYNLQNFFSRYYNVSIPKWCDWSLYRSHLAIVNLSFNS